jgi:hypothetical protein
MPLPPSTETGELPQGVHAARLEEVMLRFGSGTLQRKLIALRLARIYELALATGLMDRCVVFGSFVSGKAEPRDVDVFLLMNDAFDLNAVAGEARILFDHAAAQAHFGASVFWLRRIAALPNEADLVSSWQLKRDGTRRGIVEVVGA